MDLIPSTAKNVKRPPHRVRKRLQIIYLKRNLYLEYRKNPPFFAVLEPELRAFTLSHKLLPRLALNHDPPDLCLNRRKTMQLKMGIKYDSCVNL
jgi:hypothetical protein